MSEQLPMALTSGEHGSTEDEMATKLKDQTATAADTIAKRAQANSTETYFEVLLKTRGGELWLCGWCGTNVMVKPCPQHNADGAKDLTGSGDYFEVWKPHRESGGEIRGRCGVCEVAVMDAPCSEHARPRPDFGVDGDEGPVRLARYRSND